MKIASDLALFQTRLGYRFKQPSGLIEAVTHASKGTSTRRDYQRLEFLGDRVLGLVIAQALLAQDPEASEAGVCVYDYLTECWSVMSQSGRIPGCKFGGYKNEGYK